ncbi:hypothetical protein JL720_14864 [Aureococcus anophagefferens]|nr:hypothetical protein JL720_14864 [Aureococcus anophagefferens]
MKLTLALATGAAASGNMNGPYTVSSGAGKTGVARSATMDMVMVSPLDAPGQHPENDVRAHQLGLQPPLRGVDDGQVQRAPEDRADPADLTFHGSPKTLELVEADGARDALGDVPSSQWFSEGNGGESRKSFHGYPDGYAQLIGSPDAWHIEPMQIDTRATASAASGRSHLKAGSPYSGVLECPCTSRYGGSVEYYGEAAGTKAGGALCEAGGKNCHQFRFWFQEYEPATATAKASHSDLPRYYYLTEQNAGEYDIPPAFRAPGDPEIPGMPGWPISTSSADLHLTPGTSCVGDCPGGPDCECEHTITSHFSMSNASMIYAGGHCHAPACISIELYKNDTGTPELLCRQVSVYGEGDVAADKFDEVGYALPPCLWGSKDEGLEPPVFLGEDTPMFSITHTWNTHVGHTGQMALADALACPSRPPRGGVPSVSVAAARPKSRAVAPLNRRPNRRNPPV